MKTPDDLKSRAINLKAFVSYAGQSVVSKTLIDKQNGTLTLFAFDAGQGLSEHTAPFDAVVEILDGEAELKIGGNQVTAGIGEMVIMPANTPHSLHARQRFKMLLTMLRSE
ncbi:MAG: cupin domain-containing protein [Candidatus Firestonebacteria bacterium]|nr:cupin domain-containing protein [Candidatus Firestonebacteria bacterium]